jgi:hypothetical protein
VHQATTNLQLLLDIDHTLVCSTFLSDAFDGEQNHCQQRIGFSWAASLWHIVLLDVCCMKQCSIYWGPIAEGC